MEYSAANRKDIRAAEKSSKVAEASRQSVLVGLMSTIEGRAYVFADLEFCHVFVDPFTGDALAEAFQKGVRTVGLKLLADLMTYAPDQFILAMREANERRTANELARSSDRNRGDQGPVDDNHLPGAYVPDDGGETGDDLYN